MHSQCCERRVVVITVVVMLDLDFSYGDGQLRDKIRNFCHAIGTIGHAVIKGRFLHCSIRLLCNMYRIIMMYYLNKIV